MITILNVPDYRWFRKGGTWMTTTSSVPFFSIDDLEKSQKAYLVGVIGEEIYRHPTVIKFLNYFQRWDLILTRLSKYHAMTRRNREVPPNPPSSSTASVGSGRPSPDDEQQPKPGSMQSNRDGLGQASGNAPEKFVDSASSDASDDIDSTSSDEFDDISDEGDDTSTPPRQMGNSSSNDRIPPRSETFSSPEAFFTVPHPILDNAPDHENQVSPPLADGVLAETSVLEIQQTLKEAGPRTQCDTCRFWDIRIDDALRHRSKLLPYLELLGVKIKLDGKKKMCHWGCLDDDGNPTILSSPE
jgi:hypothetical protein